MKTIRIVQRNKGNGYSDYFELQTRSIWFPFWTVNCWSPDFRTIELKFNKMNRQPPMFKVLDEK